MKRMKRHLECVQNRDGKGWKIVLWYPSGIGHAASMPTVESWKTKQAANMVRRRLNQSFTLDQLADMFGPAIVHMDDKPDQGVSLYEELPSWEWDLLY